MMDTVASETLVPADGHTWQYFALDGNMEFYTGVLIKCSGMMYFPNNPFFLFKPFFIFLRLCHTFTISFIS